MKALLFNGSPRKNGNTAYLLNTLAEKFQRNDVEVEQIQIGGQNIRGCTACMACKKNRDERCIIDTDIVNDCIQKMKSADAIIMGSPVYYAMVTAETKALIERAGYVATWNGKFLRRKIGAGFAVARRAGVMSTFHTLNDFFLINDMIVPGSCYWNVGIAREPGEITDDAEALKVVEHLGDNIIWLGEKLGY